MSLKRRYSLPKPGTDLTRNVRQASPDTGLHLIEPVRPKQDQFLSHFRQHANITIAAEACGFRRNCVYDWLERDESFPPRFEEAREEAYDRIEQEGYRRAVKGVDEPVFFQGAVCGTVKKYSDALLRSLQQANRPMRWRENVHQNIEGNVNIGALASKVLESLNENDAFVDNCRSEAAGQEDSDASSVCSNGEWRTVRNT